MKDKKYKILLIIGFVLILGQINTSKATIIEYPLDCAGTYDRDNDIWEKNFDIGTEFTYISHVYIDWEFDIIGAKAVYDDPENPVPKDVIIAVAVGIQPNWKHQYISGGASTYPVSESFDITTEITKGSGSWSMLYDGKEYIKISYQEYLFDGYYIESGFVTLNSAKLIIDGTLVPEPTITLFITVGSLGVFRIRKRAIRNF